MSEREIFSKAIKLSGTAREAYVREACGSDDAFRARVEALLLAHDQSQELGLPAASEAAELTRSHTPESSAGTLVAGRYKLLEPIGEGGMGSVWLAEQKEPVKRKVALKLIKPGMDSRAVLARFEAERQALAVMDHPNIAKVYDGGMTSEGRPYFVMELVRGIPLTDYCDQVQLSVRERLELFAQVCSAVQHAHQKGIIHRDLKPSNILVTEHDGRPVCKVIDFGLAKAMHGVHALTDASLHTAFGSVVGTPLYMAPEQLGVSALDIDTRADLYSLGVILYELLTGSTPIEKQRLKQAALDEIVRIVREEEPPIPSQRLSSSDTLPNVAARRHTEPGRLTRLVRGDLDWIIMRALEKDRNRRYETANGLALDLQRYLNGETVLAAPPSRSYRLRKFIRKHRGPVLAGSLVVVALVAGVLGTSYGLLQANAKRQEAERQQARAEQREQDAIDAVKRFRDAVVENAELKNNPGLESLRKTLLQEPLTFFRQLRDQLEVSHAFDTDSLRRLADAAFELGVLTHEIGDQENALEAHRSALVIRERLTRKNPSAAELQQELADSHHNVGVLLATTGKPTEALVSYQRSLAIFERLARENPTAKEYQFGLASSHNSIGMLLERTGKPSEALQSYSRAIEINQRLVLENPIVTEFQSSLASCYDNIGSLLDATGEPAEALKEYDKALEIREQIASANETGVAYQSELASSHNNIAAILEKMGDLDGALQAFQRTLQIRQRLVRENPTVTSYQSDLASVHYNLGTTFHATGKLTESLQAYQQSGEIWDRLTRANPTVIDFQSRFAATNYNRGFLLDATGQADKALQAYQHALAIFEGLVRVNPTVPDYQNSLANCHNCIGRMYLSIGNLAEARQSWDAALELRKRLAHENPTVPEYQYAIAESQYNIGLLLAREGKSSDAVAAVEQSVNILERLARENPKITAYQNRLADSHNLIGTMLRRAGQPADALQSLEKSLEICLRLTRESPTVSEYHRVLAASYENLGQLLRDLGRIDDALVAYQRAREVVEKLVEANPQVPEFQSTLAGCHHAIGMLYYRSGRSKEAMVSYEQAREIQDRLIESNPTIREFQSRVADTYNSMGLLLAHIGKPQDAIAANVHAIEIYEGLVQANPTILSYARCLARNLNNVGALYSDEGQDQAAYTAFSRASEIVRQLVLDNPSNIELQSQNAANLDNLALLDERTGQFARAGDRYREALEQQNLALAANPHNPIFQEFLERHMRGLLRVLARLPDNELAPEQRLAQSEELLNDLAAKFGPAKTAEALSELGAGLLQAARFDEGKAYLQRGLELRRQVIAEGGPDAQEPAWRLALSLMDGGIAWEKHQQPARAIEWYSQAVDALQAHVVKWPGPDVTNQLRWAYQNRGWCQVLTGDYAQAINDFEEALQYCPESDRNYISCMRATARLRFGAIDEALAEIQQLATQEGGTADEAYNLACFYAVAAEKIPDQRQTHADKAMEYLQKAVEAGWNNAKHLATDIDINSLRDREDFQALAAKLEAGQVKQ